jgi:Tol biopolymer transport system component
MLGYSMFMAAMLLGQTMPTGGSVRCLTVKGGRMPAFFPDGKRLVYVWESPDGGQSLVALTLATGKARRIGKIDNVDWPVVSPDGKWIAYLSGPVFARRIWVVNPRDGEVKPVTSKAGFFSRPCWVDCGKRLAFARGAGKSQTVVSVDPFAADAKVKTYKQLGGGQPMFSPSGKLVAMVTGGPNSIGELAVVNADGSVHTKIPQVDVKNAGSPPRGCYDPSFSPDERYMVYVRSSLQPWSDIYLRDLKTGGEIPLTTDHADNQSPVFSPDGGSVAFVATRTGKAHMVFVISLNRIPTTASKPAKNEE